MLLLPLDPHTIQWLIGVGCLVIVGVLMGIDKILFGYCPPTWYIGTVLLFGIAGCFLIASLPIPHPP